MCPIHRLLAAVHHCSSTSTEEKMGTTQSASGEGGPVRECLGQPKDVK